MPLSPSDESASSHNSKSSLKSDYLLHWKVKSCPMAKCARGLAIEKVSSAQVGRKSHISLAQIQAKKDIRSGKQSTIVHALGVGKAWVRGAK